MPDPVVSSRYHTETKDLPKDLIVVPARFGSTRLPGKPLLQIAGRTLLERVVAVARAAADLAGGCDVVVATDDARIVDHARALGIEVTLTDTALDSGSARAFAAAQARPAPPGPLRLRGRPRGARPGRPQQDHQHLRGDLEERQRHPAARPAGVPAGWSWRRRQQASWQPPPAWPSSSPDLGRRRPERWGQPFL